jgi:hypothetical protein
LLEKHREAYHQNKIKEHEQRIKRCAQDREIYKYALRKKTKLE